MKDFLKKYYHNSEIGFYILKPFVNIYHIFLMDKYLSQKQYLVNKYKKYFGSNLNLENPKTLNEKIAWLKLNDKNPLQTQAADKYGVRDYVKKTLGEEYLVPLCYTTLKPKDINKNTLPDYPCIIKVNHNSSGGIIVNDKNSNSVDWKYIWNTLRWNLSENYYWNGREPQYRNIKPRIIVEKLLIDKNGNIPFDYKLHYFNGNLAFAQVDSDRLTNHKRNLYTADWKPIECSWEYPVGSFIPEPDTFKKMKELGKIIAKDFLYVRVDFYSLDSKIYFGELTFHSDGGIGPFSPEKYDRIFGEMLQLPIVASND